MDQRHVIVLAVFLATFSCYVERVGFSIAFTSLAREASSNSTRIGESLKGEVLSAFYWGYGTSQVPGGWAAQQYGGRRVLCLCFLLWSLASLLTPTNPSSTLPIKLARVCVGVAQGFLIPSVHTVLSQWIPPHERARATSLTTSGMYLGSAAAMLVLPNVAAHFGASSLLKVVGFLGLAWLAMWLAVGKEVPHRETIIPLSHQDAPNTPATPSSKLKARPAPTPWKRMLLSPAVWAIISNNFAFHYAFYIIMNWLPTYFNSVLKVELASLGSLKTLPYLVMFLTSNIGSWCGDMLIMRHYSTALARKTVNTLGFALSAGALMLMPMASGSAQGVAATTLTLGALGFARGGFSVNHMDIAPKYAGVVMGISNTAGTLSGIIGVAITGHILDWHGGSAMLGGWYQAHSLAAIICLGAAFYFSTFARGERCFN